VVDESQRQLNDQEVSSRLRQEKSSGKCLNVDPFIWLRSFHCVVFGCTFS